jgi:hypothetical protein
MKASNNVVDPAVDVDQEAENPLAEMLARTTLDSARVPSGVVMGRLLGYAESSRAPLVQFGTESASIARSVVPLTDDHVGQPVVLAFEDGDRSKPIVLGVLTPNGRVSGGNGEKTVDIQVDGERVVISAANQLVLRCGRATITLTKAGKVLIQGEYVSSRSTGVQRIRGGTVQIN